MPRSVVNLLRLSRYPILEQLWLEEALFRSHPGNWFVINDGVASPTIVLGISGKPQELVNLRAARDANIPLVRRFSGGGTVIVDADSIMTSIIAHGPTLAPDIPCYPRPIMAWTDTIFKKVFEGHMNDPTILRENDYAVQGRKFGGNAQAISKDRWLHHTSFLWNYHPQRMAILKNPSKAPEYRANRDHEAFIIPVKDIINSHSASSHNSSREGFVDALASCIESHGIEVKEGRLEEAQNALEKCPLIGSKLLNVTDYL